MKRTLAFISEPSIHESGDGDSIPSLVTVVESGKTSRASPKPPESINHEDTATIDSGTATTRGKKPRLAPAKESPHPTVEIILNPSPDDDCKEVGSERRSSTMVNLSVIHGPSDALLSNVPAEVQFPYQALDESKLEIRVITLHPGISTTPIRCSLTHVATNSKSTKPIYKALSYTWGTAETPKTITLDGIQVQARENLWQALHHLRSEEQELTIWIDALCINQNDLQERSSQVSRMSAIYGIAKEVVVWLGPADEDSKLAVDFIQQNFRPSNGPRVMDIPLDEILLEVSEAELQAVAQLMAREYWHRVWIIQEIFRARLVTLHCGYDTMKWSSLSKFFRYLSRQPDLAGPLQQRDVKEKSRFLLQACTSPAKSLTEHRTSQQHCLEDLFKAYKSCHSSDPRDKVYALIGLAQRKMRTNSEPKKRGDWIVVDYSKPTLHIFRTLVLLYEEPKPANITRLRCELVQWMQTLQEVLDLRDVLDSNYTNAMTITDPFGEPPSLASVSPVSFLGTGRLESPSKGNITCESYYISAAERVRYFASSPPWFPLTQGYGHILEWHDSVSGYDSSRYTREYLELMLCHFRDYDLERPKKFQNSMTGADSNHNARISVLLGVRYCLLMPFPIEQDCEIIYFNSSDIALAVMGTVVVGRAVIYNLESKGAEVDRTHFHAAYPEVPDPFGHPDSLRWSRKTITLSIEDWARVVSLGKRPVPK